MNLPLNAGDVVTAALCTVTLAGAAVGGAIVGGRLDDRKDRAVCIAHDHQPGHYPAVGMTPLTDTTTEKRGDQIDVCVVHVVREVAK